ncbi:MAG: dihydrodipicolinate synthase family protein [Fimbriimonadales bacterium]
MKYLRGTYPIVPTPFDRSGQLDVKSISSLAAFMSERGVSGLAILGVMGEAQKLTDDERRRVVEAFRKGLPDDCHLVVGAGAAGTDAAVVFGRDAVDLGADALLVAPPPIQNDDVIFTYYQHINEAVEVPVVLHDYPDSTGILMSARLIAELHTKLTNIRYIKLEDPPTVMKIAKVRELAGESLGVFGALGGMYAFEELDVGALGIMTGFVYPELLVKLQRLYDAGKRSEAARLFYTMLPLIRFEFQPGLGVSLRKEILVRRGAIEHATVRHPGAVADKQTLAHLDLILKHLRDQGLEV